MMENTTKILSKQGFSELENVWIPLADGRKLAARIWMPDSTKRAPAPAILEYIPYRKRDGTAPRDESTYPIFAKAGYVGVRADLSGNGESDGDLDDEYSPRELSDGLEVIAWIASQSWCSGQVGMMGISWGGFNGLQIAALKPAALKAVISLSATVDRYNDDIHYKNGCQLYSNFSWASTVLCFSARPPDPLLVGERWREMWQNRLNTQPYLLEPWLSHQRRDAYWKHGSICEDYSKLEAATLIFGGWADGYMNAPPAAVAHLQAPVKAVNGPWIHKYPHFAYPEPRMDFHAEAIRWWDRWLKNLENGAERLPAYRAYISENVRPSNWRATEEGRWVAEKDWPASRNKPQTLYLGLNGALSENPSTATKVSICSPQDCGTACGEFFTLTPDAETAGDQRSDDAGSLVFETSIVDDAIEILGRPLLRLQVALDKPVGNLIARLIDVHPDGTAFRVSWGALNLTHRQNNEDLAAMTPGVAEEIELSLNECGYRFLPGHQIRLSISTAYWPMIMPPPEVATATLTLDATSSLTLPVRPGGDEILVKKPENPSPLPVYKEHLPGKKRRWVERDLQENETRYHLLDDTGEAEMPGHGLRVRHLRDECWTISPEDPLTSRAQSHYTCWMSREDWSIRIETESTFKCDQTHFYSTAKVTAFEKEQQCHQRFWEKSSKRDFM